MAQQLISTTAGAGDTGKAGGDKLNAMMTEQYRFLDRHKPARIITDGDSIGVLMSGYSGRSPLFWAASLYPFPFTHDGSVDNFGVGSTFTNAANGLLTPSRITARSARIAACRAAGEAVICISQCGTNDMAGVGSDTDNGTASIIANYQSWWNTCRDAGANFGIVMAIPPSGGSDAARARKLLAANHALSEWCRRNRHELAFCDTQMALGTDAGETFLPAGGTVGATGSVMFDTLHPSSRGAYLQGKILGPILQRLLGVRRSILTMAGDQFIKGSTPSTVRGNVLGRQGRYFDIGGTTAQVTLSGGSGVTGVANWPSAKLFTNYPGLSGTMNGTMACAITQEAWPVALQESGRSDVLTTKLTFSGTPNADGNVKWGATVTSGLPDFADGPYDIESVLWAAGLAGFCPPYVSTVTSASGGRAWGGSNNVSDVVTMDGLLQIINPNPQVSTGNPSNMSVNTSLDFKAGVPVSGSLYIYGQAVIQNPALPTPTAV
jgi:hypothetical protein